MKTKQQSEIKLLDFTDQLPGVDIKTWFEAAMAEKAISGFLRSGLLSGSAQWAINFVVVTGLRLEADGHELEKLLAERLIVCSQVQSHRPQAATIKRVNAARELLENWHRRKFNEHNQPAAT